MLRYIRGIIAVKLTGRQFIFFLFLLCFLSFLPFSAKHFAHDSPVTLHVANQILKNPLNPQIGEFGKILEIWNHTDLDERSVYYSTPHPPLIPYIIAPFIGIFGDNRFIMGWIMFTFFFSSVVFFYKLYCVLKLPYPRSSTILFSFCPAVFVNSQDIMLDVPLMMFTLGAFYFLFRSDSGKDGAISGLFFTLGMLTKFTAGSFLFCSLFYLLYMKQWRRMVLFFTPFIILYGAWSIQNYIFYGKLQIISNGHMKYSIGDIRYRFERMLSYAGGTIVFPLIPAAIALINSGPRLIFTVIIIISSIYSALLIHFLNYDIYSAFFFALSSSSGTFIMYITLSRLSFISNPKLFTIFIHLIIQILGGGFLTCYETRYLLPFIFALFAGFSVFIHENFNSVQARFLFGISIVTSLTLSIMLSISEARNSALPELLCKELRLYNSGSIKYAGRLDYLYYMHRAGFKYCAAGDSLYKGNLILRNCQNNDDAYLFNYPGKIYTPVDTFSFTLFPIATIGKRAGFYGDDRLPYLICGIDTKRRFILYQVKDSLSTAPRRQVFSSAAKHL